MTEYRHRGLLYRALNPVFAGEPLSGRGAELYGGRFNRKGTAALYTARSPETAIREAIQVGHLQPTLLLAYDADISPIFDTRDGAALAGWSMTADALAGCRVSPPTTASLLLKNGPGGSPGPSRVARERGAYFGNEPSTPWT
ncbi:MAG: RES domain-containing protein [Rhodospirillaceae bacterium]|nr:RES domain-containing protein [Rhodospirillaceae bacterium]